MILANYYQKDIFNNDTFITAQTVEHTAKSIRTAFTAMKKYDAAVFIERENNTQVRYSIKDRYSGDLDTLERVELTFHGNHTDKGTPVLIDYKTALKDELKRI